MKKLLMLMMFVLSMNLVVANEIKVELGDVFSLNIPAGNSWKTEFDGTFSGAKCGHWAAKRYIYDGQNNESLDLFEVGRFRLGNRKVFFEQASVGNIHNPGGNTDHWAEVGDFSGEHCVRIEYDAAAGRCCVYIDNNLKGDFLVRSRTSPDMSRLIAAGFSGFVRVIEGGTVSFSGKNSSMDDVIGLGRGGGAPGQGTREFTAPSVGTVVVTAKLSTFGPARLQVEIDSDGNKRNWLVWERANDSDPSPLKLDGTEVPESMSERSPGDYSPNEMVFEEKLKKGDKVTLTLTGSFGAGTPILDYKFNKH
ncbi:MAG: hypothetical protein GQF41_1718 [Candidatus Rifleibacterium amylolyticum]|nr:MAG: hypothetical protein GQF41_1718 [Candidatus Rifleibacterium amylolyticum]